MKRYQRRTPEPAKVIGAVDLPTVGRRGLALRLWADSGGAIVATLEATRLVGGVIMRARRGAYVTIPADSITELRDALTQLIEAIPHGIRKEPPDDGSSQQT